MLLACAWEWDMDFLPPVGHPTGKRKKFHMSKKIMKLAIRTCSSYDDRYARKVSNPNVITLYKRYKIGTYCYISKREARKTIARCFAKKKCIHASIYYGCV